MIVETTDIMNIVKAEEGYELFWNNSFVQEIYCPLSRDPEEVKAECVLYTHEEAEAKRAEMAAVEGEEE